MNFLTPSPRNRGRQPSMAALTRTAESDKGVTRTDKKDQCVGTEFASFCNTDYCTPAGGPSDRAHTMVPWSSMVQHSPESESVKLLSYPQSLFHSPLLTELWYQCRPRTTSFPSLVPLLSGFTDYAKNMADMHGARSIPSSHPLFPSVSPCLLPCRFISLYRSPRSPGLWTGGTNTLNHRRDHWSHEGQPD